jgi:hypothetical protein
MSKFKGLIAILGTSALAGLGFAAAGGPAVASAAPAYQSLPGSVAEFAARGLATGAVAGSRQLTIQVWMKPNLAGAESYATGASTPGTPAYRHYLSPTPIPPGTGPPAARSARSRLG